MNLFSPKTENELSHCTHFQSSFTLYTYNSVDIKEIEFGWPVTENWLPEELINFKRWVKTWKKTRLKIKGETINYNCKFLVRNIIQYYYLINIYCILACFTNNQSELFNNYKFDWNLNLLHCIKHYFIVGMKAKKHFFNSTECFQYIKEHRHKGKLGHLTFRYCSWEQSVA